MSSVMAHAIGTTAVAGSGKTYSRGPKFLFEEFLPDGSGVHCSNLPLKVELIGKELAKKHGGNLSDYTSRMQTIPQSVLDDWMMQRNGPWDYFADKDITGWHIALDEFHKFCSSQSPKKWRMQWGVFVGEIRHRQARIEFITQSPSKVAKEIWNETGCRLVIMNSENRRDWFFKILMADWYELKAKFLTGEYVARCWTIEKREVDGKWITEDTRTFTLDPYYFQFYDSYNRPDGVTADKADADLRQFQRRSHVGLLWWFFRRNWWRTWKLSIVALICFMVFGGGAPAFRGVLWLTDWAMKNNKTKQTTTAANASPAVPSRVVADYPRHVPAGAERVPTTRSTAATGTLQPLPLVIAADPVAQVKQLTAENAKLQKSLEEIQQKFDQMGELVLITDQTCTFRDGLSYTVGATIEYGPLAGRRIKTIDLPATRVYLDDGRSIRLWRMR